MANAVMEKRTREIFREALALHHVGSIYVAGDAVESWLKTHGGWFPDPQEDYGYGSLTPLAHDQEVTSKRPSLQ